ELNTCVSSSFKASTAFSMLGTSPRMGASPLVLYGSWQQFLMAGPALSHNRHDLCLSHHMGRAEYGQRTLKTRLKTDKIWLRVGYLCTTWACFLHIRVCEFAAAESVT
ncbi:hypothetical protein, partial [Pseudorhodoplanes sp.]|uniref:hypothetical protein n=1 Tax=Pseudorhodoplanes sp. TaxID=1934341 RepID=UPI002C86CA29